MSSRSARDPFDLSRFEPDDSHTSRPDSVNGHRKVRFASTHTKPSSTPRSLPAAPQAKAPPAPAPPPAPAGATWGCIVWQWLTWTTPVIAAITVAISLQYPQFLPTLAVASVANTIQDSVLQLRALAELSTSTVFPSPEHATEVPPHIANYVHQAIQVALESIEGRHNFALAAAGAKIVPGLTSRSLLPPSGIPDVPENIIRVDPSGGHCWTSIPAHAQIGIRLPSLVYPSHIAIEAAAIPRSMLASAPRRVILWGLIDGYNSTNIYDTVLDEYRREVEQTTGPAPTQTMGYQFIALAQFDYDVRATFPLQIRPISPPIVESGISFGVLVIEFVSNGGAETTTVCGIRLHGKVPEKDASPVTIL